MKKKANSISKLNRYDSVPDHVLMDKMSYIRLEKERNGTYRVCYRLNGCRKRKTTGTNILYRAARYMTLMLAKCDISGYSGPLYDSLSKAKLNKKIKK